MYYKDKTNYYEKDFNYKKFLIQYILRSEFIGFGILTPFFAALGYFIIEIPPNIATNFFLTAFLTAFIVLIYVVISNIYYLRYFKKYIKYVYENTNISLTDKEKISFIEKFFRLPLVRSIDVFIRTSFGIILFSVIVNFYLNYSLYQMIVSLSIFFIFSSSAGIIYYILLENLIHNIINSKIFKEKLKIENLENLKFLKFKYTLSYLFFLSFFMISSISSLIASEFNKYWIRKFHREKIQEHLNSLSFILNNYFVDIKTSIYNLEMQIGYIVSNPNIKNNNLNPFVKEYLLKDNSILDYAIYDKAQNEFYYSYSYYIVNEKNMIYELTQNYQEFYISNGFRLSKGDPLRIFAILKPFKKDFYHVIFINISKLEDTIYKNIDKNIEAIVFILDKNNNIISTTDSNLVFQPIKTIIPESFLNIKQESTNPKLIEKIYYNKDLHELLLLHEPISNFKLGILFSKSIYQNAIAFSIFILATIFMFIGFIFIFFIIYVISIKTQSLDMVVNFINQIARGNLRRRNMFIYNDEFGNLSINLINLNENLRNTVRKTKDLLDIATNSSKHFKELTNQLVYDSENEAASTEEISATTEEISATMDKIAEFSNEQTFLINNLSNGVNELTNVIKEAQQNLKEIRSIIRESDEIKQKSEKEINDMSNAMNQIQQTSSKITNIVNIVKEIADQINLLSLNASIEAARAGEYGKGFAVVADEVSKLADKTMNSIKEINSLIKNSNEQIQYGISISRRVNEFLNYIIKEIQRINELSTKVSEVIVKQEFVNTGVLSQTKSVYDKSNEIKSIITEQKTAIREITESIASINRNILNSSESSKKINSSAFYLDDKIKELENLIKTFELEDED